MVLNRMPTSPAADALLHLRGQVEQVHVAGVALVPHAGDADLGLVHILFGEPGAVEHRLRGALRSGLGDANPVDRTRVMAFLLQSDTAACSLSLVTF
jgi:hypothetical protein